MTLSVTCLASVNDVNECRNEAEMYGVPPEQFDDYVHGCVLSRGGYVPDAGGEQQAPAMEVDSGMSDMQQDMPQDGNEAAVENVNGAQ